MIHFLCLFDSFSADYWFIYDDYIDYYRIEETNIIKFWNNICIALNSLTGCSNCGSQNSNIEYINPLIMFDENDILNSNIISKINSIVKNDLNICEKCNYSKNHN